MATGNTASPAGHQIIQQHPQHAPPASQATSPPTKQNLTSWWRTFKKTNRKEEEKEQEPTGIFGVPLQISIKYANVAISLSDENGKSFIYGYVPIVVAKCGVYLKEKATDVEGIFRLSGSAKRIKDLQAAFNSPDRYGKGLDWTGYTVHDAANIFRRYLNQLPEPIIPLDIYVRFRDPLRSHEAQAVGDMEAQAQDMGDFDHDAAIKTYQRLITELPPLNRQLLLYILDLLAVFASKSDLNRMTSANLSAIFQPGLLSHPMHDMMPQEYRLSQDVLIFLIENQDNFLIGMKGTAADEKTVQEVQSAGPTPQPTTPTTPMHGRSKLAMGRSSSNASAGADSIRKFGIRRNVSVSSKNSNSNQSPVASSYGSPLLGNSAGGGVHRSNTAPSRKSPVLPSPRFNRDSHPSSPTSAALSPPAVFSPTPGSRTNSSGGRPTDASFLDRRTSSLTPTAERPSTTIPYQGASEAQQTQEDRSQKQKLMLDTPANAGSANQLSPSTPSTSTPKGERKKAFPFSKSPSSDGERKESRPPNKLRKKRIPGSANQSAHSSSHSLHESSAIEEAPSSPMFHNHLSAISAATYSQLDTITSPPPPEFSNTQATPTNETPHQSSEIFHSSSHSTNDESGSHHPFGTTLRPAMSPTPSFHSHSSLTDFSDFDQLDDAGTRAEKKEKKHRWMLSSQKNGQQQLGTASGGSHIGSMAAAERSTSSIGSSGRPRKSITNDSQQLGSDHSSGLPSTLQHSSNESALIGGPGTSRERETEKKGPLEWIRSKVREAKEDKKEKEAEKERAKSPPPQSMQRERAASKQSLPPVTEGLAMRGRSIDVRREEPADRPPESAAASGIVEHS
ncbi:MAG: hypothetical protein M1827_004124 [Pycnora praestabilis]|nr:MAG: hypothetical protein M1827_004124 [Pycnora praestabilis]